MAAGDGRVLSGGGADGTLTAADGAGGETLAWVAGRRTKTLRCGRGVGFSASGEIAMG
jgi:hypothetical protein